MNILDDFIEKARQCQYKPIVFEKGRTLAQVAEAIIDLITDLQAEKKINEDVSLELAKVKGENLYYKSEIARLKATISNIQSEKAQMFCKLEAKPLGMKTYA